MLQGSIETSEMAFLLLAAPAHACTVNDVPLLGVEVVPMTRCG